MEVAALMIIACATATPDACRTYRHPMAEVCPVIPGIGDQLELTRWKAAHPWLTVRRYRCVPASRLVST